MKKEVKFTGGIIASTKELVDLNNERTNQKSDTTKYNTDNIDNKATTKKTSDNNQNNPISSNNNSIFGNSSVNNNNIINMNLGGSIGQSTGAIQGRNGNI